MTHHIRKALGPAHFFPNQNIDKIIQNTEQQLAEEDKLMYIHHMLCNLILLSYSLHANQVTRVQGSLLQTVTKKI